MSWFSGTCFGYLQAYLKICTEIERSGADLQTKARLDCSMVQCRSTGNKLPILCFRAFFTVVIVDFV